MQVTILGPNLTTAQQKLGAFHVHRAHCADIARNYNDPSGRPLTTGMKAGGKAQQAS